MPVGNMETMRFKNCKEQFGVILANDTYSTYRKGYNRLSYKTKIVMGTTIHSFFTIQSKSQT